MKRYKILSAVFAAVGLMAAAAAIYLTLSYRNAEPMLLTPPNVAKSQAAAMMNAVCKGDYETASGYLLGNPSLGVDRDASDEVGVMIWEAFTNSLSYEMVGPCYATDDGLAQRVELTGLDIECVTQGLRERAQTMLQQRVENAEDTSEVYDENNDYRESFVMQVLSDAVAQALEENSQQKTVSLTLNLTYQDGKWYVVADNQLLDAISGGILY